MIKPIMSSPVVRKFALGAMMAGAVAGMSSCEPATKAEQVTKKQLIEEIDRSNKLPSFVSEYFRETRYYLDRTQETIEKNGTYYGIIEQTQKIDNLWYGGTLGRIGSGLRNTDREYDNAYIVGFRLERNMSKKYAKDAEADKKALCGPNGDKVPSLNECIYYIDNQLMDLLPSEEFVDYLQRCSNFQAAQGYETTQTAANLLSYRQMQLDSVRCVREIIETITEAERREDDPRYFSRRLLEMVDEKVESTSDHVRPKPIKDPNGRGDFFQQIKDWFKSL